MNLDLEAKRMNSKYVSLCQLTSLLDNDSLSEKYVRYISGAEPTKQYRHSELTIIKQLIDYLDCDNDAVLSGFLYGYEIPQLNKEFDLIKITNEVVVNIELRSQPKDSAKTIIQLEKNRYYLKMLNLEVANYLFVASENELYRFTENGLIKADSQELLTLLKKDFRTDIDLDAVFSPAKVLISPINDPQLFIEGKYLLTENQSNIETRILSEIDANHEEPFFFAVKGKPGTGKTLLLYDIGKKLCEKGTVLVIHSGIKSAGHQQLENSIDGMRVIEAKDLRYREIKNSDYVLVDESQRLYESALLKVISWAKKTKTICVFSLDEGQRLSHRENKRQTVDTIMKLCGNNVAQLTNKIRTNKEIAFFITCLFDLSKLTGNHVFPNVKIIYEPDIGKAIQIAMRMEGYQYISYTTSIFRSFLDLQESELNTHRVIGQEFPRVVMILDNNFYYENSRLKAYDHPNPDYIFEKLLYQGLTRAKEGIALVITMPSLLEKVLTLFRLDNN